MNLLAWLNPYRWILLAAFVAAVGLGVPILIHRHDAAQQLIGYQRRADEDRKVIEAQAASNRELQRDAEKRYVVKREGQDHYFTQTIKEIVHDAAPMAACSVPDAVRVRLNSAAACASGDSPAACLADDEVPRP